MRCVFERPPDRTSQAYVLIAFEMNKKPLRAEQGFPARLVVPGYYGTNSVKWLARITVADKRAEGPFTVRWYNDQILDGSGNSTGRTKPVWSIAPESLIVSPSPEAEIRLREELEIWGWAWADGQVAEVTISVDNGVEWLPASLEPRSGRSWQRFSLLWRATETGSTFYLPTLGTKMEPVSPVIVNVMVFTA